jgi:hypothetical protein
VDVVDRRRFHGRPGCETDGENVIEYRETLKK